MLTGREAMETADQAATAGQFEEARFWLDFAREIREDFAMRRMWDTFGKPSRVAENFDMKTDDRVSLSDTGVIRVPVPRPGEMIEGDGRRCINCGYFCKEAGVRGDGSPHYVHTRTAQAMCPGNAGQRPDDTWIHTFAQP